MIGPGSFNFTRQLLSIIIVTLDNAKSLDLLLRGLEKNTKSVPFEVLVHCNSALDISNNETIKVISKWQEEGIVTNLTTSLYNHYVAAPANALARFTHGNYIVFLDDDTYPSPGWDAPLLDAVSSSHYCSFVTPTLFYPHAKEEDVVYNNFSFGEDPESFREDEFNRDWEVRRRIRQTTNGICGNFIMTKELWDEIGGFDSSFDREQDVDIKAKVRDLAKDKYEGQYSFVAVADSCLYHFGHTGSSKAGYLSDPMMVKDQFKRKWGITPGQFSTIVGKELGNDTSTIQR